ncbi:hypothetical protein SAMN05660836_00053 [Thermodesulforhabdus norvegica]|uniref:Uncharacterized protein n=1 Tax=Thermodesulforhabdus norvegica TaxID=39841 RepID=A0A1I4QJ24_9BACT|nr:hypothetical protein SAMN05660836_00053 [Thermodesulforhabdus norvegica]
MTAVIFYVSGVHNGFSIFAKLKNKGKEGEDCAEFNRIAFPSPKAGFFTISFTTLLIFFQ